MADNDALHVLAVGAHPDDLEIQIAGTLAKYARRGAEVTMAIACLGDAGSTEHGADESTEIRRLEAEVSARVIGARLVRLGYPDAGFFSNLETRLRMIDLIREARADVILAHWPGDYHPDHAISGQVLCDARISAALPNIKTEHPALTAVPALFFYDTLAGIDFNPEVYVDIEETFAVKQEMLGCHRSQGGFLKEIYGVSLVEFMEVQTRFRGMQCGKRYAEGFRSLETFPRQMNTALLPF